MEHHHINWLMDVILPWANFLIFFGAAVFIFRKPAVAAARKQRDDFEKLRAEAVRARDVAQEKLDILRKRESALAAEIAETARLSKVAAEAEAAKIISDAERVATHLKTEAKRIAAAEVENARAAIRRDIVAALKEAVTTRIQKDFNEAAHLALARQRVSDLQQMNREA